MDNAERKELGKFILEVMLPNISTSDRILYFKYMPLEEEDPDATLFNNWKLMLTYLASANKAFLPLEKQCEFMEKYVQYAQELLPSHIYSWALEKIEHFCPAKE